VLGGLSQQTLERLAGERGGQADQMVSRYLRFADKFAAARASRDRREQKQAEFVNTAADLLTNRR